MQTETTDALLTDPGDLIPLAPESGERKPAAEAFADAAALLDDEDIIADDENPVQGDLPGVFPVFNFQGAYEDLEAKAVEVDALERAAKDAAREARETKKTWQSAAEVFTKMALEYRRRRRAKDEPAPDASNVEPDPRGDCTWEAAHPGAVCPFRAGGLHDDATLARLAGTARAPHDAEAHVDEVDAFLAGLDIEQTGEALAQHVLTIVDTGEIAGWSAEDRAAARAWATAIGTGTSTTANTRPTVLGRPHIPAPMLDGVQRCSICDEPLVKSSNAADRYEVTDLVGTDCAGAPKEGHRYPARRKRGKKAAAAIVGA